jgi:predicted  nucleic acid-binding Zn-ribbon protein
MNNTTIENNIQVLNTNIDLWTEQRDNYLETASMLPKDTKEYNLLINAIGKINKRIATWQEELKGYYDLQS